MSPIRIRQATLPDLEPLLDVAVLSYREHYADIWAPGSLDLYFDYAYSGEVFRAFLTEPDVLVWVAEEEERFVGYLVFKTETDLTQELPGGCQIKRLYLLRTATGKGLGPAMLQIALEAARRLGRTYAWLDVMKCSPEAVAFYEREGFRIHSDKSFTLIPFRRPELSELWNMVLPLE